jgi:hypothetical protein
LETTPRRGTVYRCSVCRLELVIDETSGRMTVAPLSASEEPTPTRPKRIT